MKKSIFVIISLILISSPIAVHAEWGGDSETIENECNDFASLEAACLQRYQICDNSPYTEDGDNSEPSGKKGERAEDMASKYTCEVLYGYCLFDLKVLCGEKDPIVQPAGEFISGNLKSLF